MSYPGLWLYGRKNIPPQRGLLYLVCVSVCVSVCVYALIFSTTDNEAAYDSFSTTSARKTKWLLNDGVQGHVACPILVVCAHACTASLRAYVRARQRPLQVVHEMAWLGLCRCWRKIKKISFMSKGKILRHHCLKGRFYASLAVLYIPNGNILRMEGWRKMPLCYSDR